jgi:hypothetical protein
MLFNWLFRLLIPFWDDLTINPATGKASLKNVAATVGFIVGIGLAVVSVYADLREGRPVEKSAIMLLLANGLGLSALKIWAQQANRETATPEGQPLAQPGTTPPVLMPQGNDQETGTPAAD